MADRGFRVVIVGGSIAGLTLALALEKHGVDFVVLEAYPEIAPQVGASIAVLPNGFRILDQLGCFEDILAKVNCTIDNFIIRDSDGKVLVHVDDLDHHLIQRHGYPMIFFERRMVIEVLHKHIEQKHKVLTSKRVVNIEQNADSVSAVCQDGGRFEGSILIGADGIHSTVSQEIRQAAVEKNPQLKKDEFPVQYRCLFGISEKVPGIAEDTLHHITNEGSSSFAASGPNDRTYWCLFFNAGSTYHDHDLPPYGPEEEAETARKHENDAVTETVKFGDLYKRKLMTVCTPLHEGVLENWHSQRCMVIGDAVHKFNPIIGLGGMSAMETCAALTNNLTTLLKLHSTSSPIPSSAIESMFSATQALRKPRAAALVDASQKTQYRFAMETTYLRFLNRFLYPSMGPGPTLRLLSEAYPGAVSFSTLPTPRKPRALPYEDELLRQPAPRSTVTNAVVTALLIALSLFGSYALFTVGKINGTFPLLREAVEKGAVSELGNFALTSAFGSERLPKLDRLVRTLVAAFLPVLASSEGPEGKLQACYFLLSTYLPLLAIIVVEGYRKRNAWSSVWSPSLWTGAAQLFGLGVILPLYILAFYLNSKGTAYWMPAERSIPRSVSKAILPSLSLGFLVPSALMIWLNGTGRYNVEIIAFWQITPVLVVFLVEIVAKLTGLAKSPARHDKAPVEDYQGLDLPYLRLLYDILFVISASIHVAVVAVLGLSSGISITRTFFPSSPTASVSTVAAGMSIFFKFDLLLVIVATFIWTALNIVDLRRVGLSGTPVLKSLGLLLAGYVLVGPGATTAAFWKWRENKMAQPEKRKA